MNREVVHDKKHQRFTMQVDNNLEARVDYTLHGNLMRLVYCYVPPQLRGQGVGQDICIRTFEMLTEEGYEAEAICSYVRSVARNSEKWSKIIG